MGLWYTEPQIQTDNLDSSRSVLKCRVVFSQTERYLTKINLLSPKNEGQEATATAVDCSKFREIDRSIDKLRCLSKMVTKSLL